MDSKYKKQISLNSLKHLFEYNSEYKIQCKKQNVFHTGVTLLHKLVVNTKKYPFLDDYIEEYLKTDKGKKDLITKDHLGFTPIILAYVFIEHTRSKTFRLLIEADQIRNLELIKYSRSTNFYDYYKTSIMTSLFYDFLYKNFEYEDSYIEIIKILIRKGIDINCKDKCGNTPLILLCLSFAQYSSSNPSNKKYINYFITGIKLLLEKGANINIRNDNDHDALCNTFIFSLNSDSYEIIKLLIDNGADLETKDFPQMIPLMILYNYSICYNRFNYDIINLIRGKNPPIKDRYDIMLDIFDTYKNDNINNKYGLICSIIGRLSINKKDEKLININSIIMSELCNSKLNTYHTDTLINCIAKCGVNLHESYITNNLIECFSREEDFIPSRAFYVLFKLMKNTNHHELYTFLIKPLVLSGVNLNVKDTHGNSIVSRMIKIIDSKYSVKITKLLIDNGASFEFNAIENLTCSLYERNIKISTLLLESDKNIDAKSVKNSYAKRFLSCITSK